MSQQEFDNYLALLGRLLRFDAKQREAVAEEFRAHLEDRLDDLLARGYDRDQAVRLAIEEFGDAAGLAAELANISRGRRRRWIMRCTTATVGGLAAIVLLAMALWPDNGSVPAPARLIAQEETKPASEPTEKKTGPEQSTDPFADTHAQRPKEVALAQSVTVDFVEVSLRDAIEFLSDMTGSQFYVKSNRLDDAGVTLADTVTLNLKDVRLSTVLELMLEQVDLTYVDRDELILITTLDDAEATMEVRVYDCRDLLALRGGLNSSRREPPGGGGFFNVPDKIIKPVGQDSILPQFGGGAPPPAASSEGAAKNAAPSQSGGMGSGGFGGGTGGGLGGFGEEGNSPQSDSDVLIELLTTTVEPETWDETGGPGSLAMYNGLLVVRQSSQTHAKVERVLNMLRSAAGLNPKDIRVTK